MFKRWVCVILATILSIIVLPAATVSSYHSVLASQDQEPIEVVSVLGPVPPFNPGGAVIEITLKNVSLEPVISLYATLEIATSLDFTFVDVTPSDPLQPNRMTSASHGLIRGGFNNDDTYPLTINATLQNGANFVYTKVVQIAEPQIVERPLIPVWGWAVIAIVIVIVATAAIVFRRRRAMKV